MKENLGKIKWKENIEGICGSFEFLEIRIHSIVNQKRTNTSRSRDSNFRTTRNSSTKKGFLQSTTVEDEQEHRDQGGTCKMEGSKSQQLAKREL
jgi:hypothetical protein